jgi:uncharacterized protein YkwD
VRDRLAWALLLGSVLGCGDGIGHPIVQREPASGGATGFSGTAGAANDAGTTTSPGVGGTGGSAGTAGSAGLAEAAGMGGSAGAVAGGGAGPAGMSGGSPPNPPGAMAGFSETDFGAPWGAGFGGRGDAPDRGNEDPLNAVPMGEHCASVVEWDRRAAEVEQELFRFLNFARESGFACAEEASAPLPPLQLRPELRCAARLHSRDMRERNFFDHVNPDDEGPEERMRAAGATFAVAGESIAQDLEMPEFDDPYQALSGLFAEDGSDCRNVMDGRFEAVGVGMFQGLWTLDFTGR